MNSDQVKGKFEQVVGQVKQSVGEAFGDSKTANEGLGDQVKGAAKETWGNAKDAATVDTSAREGEATDRSSEIRQNLSEKIQNAKAAVNERIDEYKTTHSR